MSPSPTTGLAWIRYRPIVATNAERRAARDQVSATHQAQLAELLGRVGAAIDRYRTGEIDAYAMDETIHHYHRAAAELWNPPAASQRSPVGKAGGAC